AARKLSLMPEPEQLTLPQRPIVIGIAGCSGSGKTTLARELATQLDGIVFPLDLYYRDLSRFPLDSRDKRNFDHPDSLESELFIEHLRELRQGHTIQRPIYDFSHFVDAPNQICLNRRIYRDMRERGRTEESVRAQFDATAKPMAERYVIPSQGRATMKVCRTDALDWSIQQIFQELRMRGLVS